MSETKTRCAPAHNPEIDHVVDRIDAMLTFIINTDEPEGLSLGFASPIYEAFGSAVRRLGQRILKLGGHDALLSAAQLIAIRHPRTRNERIDILSKRWADIDDNDEAQE
jgi:hypothetical protein